MANPLAIAQNRWPSKTRSVDREIFPRGREQVPFDAETSAPIPRAFQFSPARQRDREGERNRTYLRILVYRRFSR